VEVSEAKPPMTARTTNALLLCLYAFLLGFSLMSFEMLGSRYLYPYFGGGLNTWAVLISVVLIALMVGYFVGGMIADAHPDQRVLGAIIATSGLYMLAIPLISDKVILFALDVAGDGPVGAFLATVLLLAFPLTALSVFSPFSVRLLITAHTDAGRISGLVYAVSTAGNILGVLVTSFWLIPTMGSRAITYGMGAVTLATALAIMAVRLREAAPRPVPVTSRA